MEPGTRIVYRRIPGWIAFVVASLLALFLIGDAGVRASWFDAMLVAPWLLLVLWAIFVFFAAPTVTATTEGVTVRNMLRVTDIPWRAVAEVRMRWQVEVALRDGSTVPALGAAPRRLHLRKGDGMGSDQVETLELFRERADRMGPTEVASGWHRPTLIALAAIVLWAAWSLVMTGGPVLG